MKASRGNAVSALIPQLHRQQIFIVDELQYYVSCYINSLVAQYLQKFGIGVFSPRAFVLVQFSCTLSFV